MCRQGIIPKQKEFFPKGNRGFPRTGVGFHLFSQTRIPKLKEESRDTHYLNII